METCFRCGNKIKRITKKNNWDWEFKGFLCEVCIKLEEINEEDFKHEANIPNRIKIAEKVFC